MRAGRSRGEEEQVVVGEVVDGRIAANVAEEGTPQAKQLAVTFASLREDKDDLVSL